MSDHIILVTGGLGFIGSHVCETLNEIKHRFVVLDFDRSSANIGLVSALDSCVAIIHHDITDSDAALDLALAPFRDHITGVIHLAAAISVAESMSQGEHYMRTNAEGSERLLRWAAAAPACVSFVAASSAAVYGNPEFLPLTEHASRMYLSPYAASKGRMEDSMAAASAPLSRTALRFFNVFGPRQDPTSPYAGVISLFMRRTMPVADGIPSEITIYGDGEQTRDFIYVKDVAAVCVKCATQPTHNGFTVMNVASSKRTSINTLVQAIKYHVGVELDPKLKVNYAPEREGDIKESWATAAAMRRVMARPLVSFDEGLRETLEWMQGE